MSIEGAILAAHKPLQKKTEHREHTDKNEPGSSPSRFRDLNVRALLTFVLCFGFEIRK